MSARTRIVDMVLATALSRYSSNQQVTIACPEQTESRHWNIGPSILTMVPPFLHIVQLRSDSSITGQARMILLCHLGGMLWVASLAQHTGPWGVYSQGLNCNLDAVSWYSARSGVAARTEPFTAQTSALMCGFLSYYHTLPSQLPSINTIAVTLAGHDLKPLHTASGG